MRVEFRISQGNGAEIPVVISDSVPPFYRVEYEVQSSSSLMSWQKSADESIR